MLGLSKANAAILTVLVACAVNVITLELLVKQDPGVGNLVTFSSFLFITIEGFIFTTKCGTVSPKVPFTSWTTLVIMYFIVSVTNNYALNFNISMPLHMIFRAGSLMANMVLGMLLLHKRYTPTKYLSVIMITIGIATCTIMSAQTVKDGGSAKEGTDGEQGDKEDSSVADENWEMVRWFIGISMLTFALFMSARMGIYQEVIYKKYGKYPKEALFYSHCLPMPFFIFLGKDIYEHFSLAMASESASVSLLGASFSMPSMLLYLALNVATQYACISAVFVLTSECASLTVTLVVTLRKFLSLLFSIWYFENPFTAAHWVGTALVFGGTLLFSDVHGMMAQRLRQQQPKTSKNEKSD